MMVLEESNFIFKCSTNIVYQPFILYSHDLCFTVQSSSTTFSVSMQCYDHSNYIYSTLWYSGQFYNNYEHEHVTTSLIPEISGEIVKN